MTRITRLATLTVFISVAAGASQTLACSAALLMAGDTPVVARNYDWHLGHALAMVNQPGIEKLALTLETPARWTSKYGSVTINQYGRELPQDGMNEAGLAIVVLWLDETEYPKPDGRPTVTAAQWVQYQLDTAATVNDVVDSDEKIRITPLGGARVHYFVADAKGNSAVIEFLEGEMVAHYGDALKHALITNDTCTASHATLARHLRSSRQARVPTGGGSLDRYVRLASAVQAFAPTDQSPTAAAFAAIDTVRNPQRTRWQSVCDLKNKQFCFRTLGNESVRTVDLTKIDFAATNPAQVLEIQAPLAGDITSKFRDYRSADNRELIQRSFSATGFARSLPAALIEQVILYPEVSCRPAR